MSEWKMVPVDPTPEMLQSAVENRHGNAVYKCVTDQGIKDLELEALFDYRAMLSAAPAHPSNADSGVSEPAGYIDREQWERWQKLRGGKYETPRGYIGFSFEPFDGEMSDCTLPIYTHPNEDELVKALEAIAQIDTTITTGATAVVIARQALAAYRARKGE